MEWWLRRSRLLSRAMLAHLLAAAGLLAWTACAKKPAEPEPELKVSTQAIAATAAGGGAFFHVAANRAWSASSTEPWCTLAVSTGQSGTTKVDIQVAPHGGTAPRSATIAVVAGPLKQDITVTQEGATLLEVDAEQQVGVGGGELAIRVEASGVFQVEVAADWITHAGSDPGVARFEVGVNRGLSVRAGTIRFTLGGVEKEVTVNQDGQPPTIAPDMTGVPRNARALIGGMGLGWNLGNSLEAASSPTLASETLWGNPKTSKAMIDAVKAAGFDAVRIPCAWSGYMEDQTTYRVSDAWLARVKEVVDYCVANDLYVVINTHWDGGWLEEHPLYSHQAAVTEKFTALWKQVAVYFRDYDERLLFAGTNEVRADYNTPTAEHLAVQASYNQVFVETVRATGGRNAYRNLVVQAYNTNINHARDFFRLPVDAVQDRLVMEVHYYDPYDFTLDAESSNYLWGQEFAGYGNVSNWGQEAWVDQSFAIVKSSFIDKGIPVILGEYAATLRLSLPEAARAQHVRARNHYLGYVTKAARAVGMVPFYWDSGHTGNNGSGLFDRATATPAHPDAIAAIVGAR